MPIANQTSNEVIQSVLEQLKLLGPKGHKMLEELQKSLTSHNSTPNSLPNESSTKTQAKTIETNENGKLSKENERIRRQIEIKTNLQEELSKDDSEDNLAEEVTLKPDGEADHHVKLDERTLFDRSNSEFWSSFSSSEEALLNCEGLILSLPLKPSRLCSVKTKEKFSEASFSNTITYT